MPTSAEMLGQLLPVIRAAADVRLATRASIQVAAGDFDNAPIHLLATGKASLEMASEACNQLGARVVRGIVTAVPERITGANLPDSIATLPADHPLPTHRNLEAARRVAAFVLSVPATDLLLALISGGGSAHLTLPAGDLTLIDLRSVTGDLQRAGATIDELNTVRKHCEQLKGGRLALMRQSHASHSPARTHVLVVSDVIGDRPDVISSGPFSPDPTTYADALAILDRHHLVQAAPAVVAHLRRGIGGHLAETPKPGDASFGGVNYRIISSNASVVRACRDHLSVWCDIHACREQVVGEASQIGAQLAIQVREASAGAGGRPVAFILGGEWTVTAGATPGAGGPSQELALAAAIEIAGTPNAAVLAYSTDGIDGPTSAAGALVEGCTSELLRSAGKDPLRSLQSHDSHTALQAANALITTGPTGTNVNHLAIGLAVPSYR